VPRKSRPTDTCPHCYEEFPAGRLACPHCGSDAETGWSREGITGEAHGLPDEFTDDDYDDVLRAIGALPARQRFPTWIVVAAIVAVAAFALAFVF
jgi:hypothetical protein